MPTLSHAVRAALPLYTTALLIATACQTDGGIDNTPKNLVKEKGDAQPASISKAVLIPPQVRVTDGSGKGVAAITVTFAVSTGGGTVTGATQVTDTAGLATVGAWTMGSAIGSYSLTASANGLSDVTFTANAVDPCATTKSYTLGTTVADSLTAIDCTLSDNSFIKYHSFSTSSNTAIKLKQKSTVFDPYTIVYDNVGALAGQNDSSSTNKNTYLRILAPAGTYRIGAGTFLAAKTGTYTLETSTVAEGGSGCESVLLLGLISTSQSLLSTDCVASGGYYTDVFIFYARQGITYTVTQTTTAFDPWMGLYTAGGTPLSSSFATGSGTRQAKITFTLTNGNALLQILAETNTAAQSGSYTFAIAPGPVPPPGGTAQAVPLFIPPGEESRQLPRDLRILRQRHH